MDDCVLLCLHLSTIFKPLIHFVMLKEEFDFYIKNQSEFVEKYKGKFIVIKGKEVIGVYDTEIIAYAETIKNEELGTFLIQECQPGNESYTQTFRTRVIF